MSRSMRKLFNVVTTLLAILSLVLLWSGPPAEGVKFLIQGTVAQGNSVLGLSKGDPVYGSIFYGLDLPWENYPATCQNGTVTSGFPPKCASGPTATYYRWINRGISYNYGFDITIGPYHMTERGDFFELGITDYPKGTPQDSTGAGNDYISFNVSGASPCGGVSTACQFAMGMFFDNAVFNSTALPTSVTQFNQKIPENP
jgi:hypothetical protein